ncbi:MAG: hypothetical protein PWQ57_3362 [Desulfovibrionales bacterium]|nr:hypothetical protein [Desulfovibrionales bacterium]
MRAHTPNDSDELARDILRRFAELERRREPYHALWEDIANYAGPSFGGFTSDKEYPVEPEAEVVDTTLRRSAAILSSGLLSFLSSPSQRWFRLTHPDRSAADDKQVRVWLQQVEDVFYGVLTRSCFYAHQHTAYHISGLFGVKALYVDEAPDGELRFMARPLQELYLAQDHLGRVDTVFRRFKLSARQAVQAFGREQVGEAVRRAADDGRDEETFTFLHAVYPAEDKKLAKGMPVASVYLDLDGQRTLSVGGFEESPYIVDRWQEHPATAYSADWPGLSAIADSRMVNEMKRLILESGQLAAAPPLWVPDDGFVGRISMEPRAINYYDKAAGNQISDFGPMSAGGDPRFGLDLLNMSRRDIQEAFFVDLFLTVRQRIQQGGAPTATEISELAQEKMFLLGPMLYRQQESFDRLFNRMFRLLWRRGEIPPPPRTLKGRPFDVDYVSPLALAQKEAQTKAILQTYRDVAPIAQVDASVLENFKHDVILRRIAEQRGFPQTGLRSEQEVAEFRARKAEAVQQSELQSVAGQMMERYGDLSKAPEEGSPAEEVLTAMAKGAVALPGRAENGPPASAPNVQSESSKEARHESGA